MEPLKQPYFPEIEYTIEEDAEFEQLDTKQVTASSILEIAADLIGNRAKDRDIDSERSMGRCVKAFNAMTAHALTEEDGWLFMQYLKQARSRGGKFRFDDYLDDVAYCALRAECAASGKLK